MGGLARVKVGALTAVMTAELVQTADNIWQATKDGYTIAATRRYGCEPEKRWIARLFVCFEPWDPCFICEAEGATEGAAREEIIPALIEVIARERAKQRAAA